MIFSLIVTYNDRRKFLLEVLNYTESIPEINRVLVIGNGTPYNLNQFIAQNSWKKVTSISFDSNMGSAYAFSKGLKSLEEKNDKAFVFILDDDNLPLANAIDFLAKSMEKLTGLFPKKKIMLASLRINRSYLNEAASGSPQRFFFPQMNAFLGFNLFRIPDIFWWKIIGRKRSKFSDPDWIKIPMAPYGGLFFNLDLLKQVGFPNEEFFVYGDDFEFTYRVTKNGGSIFLIVGAKITDLEKSWLNMTQQSFFKSRYLQQSDFRAYLSIRNFTFFVKNNLVDNMWLFNLNRRIYSIYLWIIALFLGRLREYGLIKNAIKDGMQGKLGPYKSH